MLKNYFLILLKFHTSVFNHYYRGWIAFLAFKFAVINAEAWQQDNGIS